MPEVFANTTPLQYLHRLGKLDWLHTFYGSVTVPLAEADELDAGIELGAKREGFRTAVAPLLESLQREGFRNAPATFAEALRLAGE